MTVEEGIKLVISGGIVVPQKRSGMESVAEVAAAATRAHDLKRAGILRKLRNYFFAGVLVTAPISITVWLAWGFISFVDDWVTPMIPPSWNPETYLPFSIPGLGVVLLVIVFTTTSKTTI